MRPFYSCSSWFHGTEPWNRYCVRACPSRIHHRFRLALHQGCGQSCRTHRFRNSHRPCQDTWKKFDYRLYPVLSWRCRWAQICLHSSLVFLRSSLEFHLPASYKSISSLSTRNQTCSWTFQCVTEDHLQKRAHPWQCSPHSGFLRRSLGRSGICLDWCTCSRLLCNCRA